MKIFLDSANIAKIKQLSQTGLIDGITTNPSNLSAEGGDPTKHILELCSIFKNGEINIEVNEKKPDEVYKQAKEIAKIANNVLVKIPCHPDYFEVIHKLVNEGIKLNITLVFTMLQSLMMAKLGVKYISPFIARWNDIDVDGKKIIKETRQMLDHYNFNTKLLAASIRSVRDFHDAIINGADIVTLPIDVFEKSIKHVLTDQGIEKFDKDWQKLGIENSHKQNGALI